MTLPDTRDWPSVVVPLPVKFAFDPTGAMYFTLSSMHDRLDVAINPRHYVTTARNLFLPHLASLNTAPALGDRTPEAITQLPTWEEAQSDVQRWLA